MQRIGFQRLTAGFLRGLFQVAGAEEVDRDRDDHDQDRGRMRVDIVLARHEPQHRLIDDPDAGGEEEHRLGQRRDTLVFRVAVVMFGVGRLVRQAHSDERDDGRGEIEQAVNGLRQNAERTGPEGSKEFQERQTAARKHRLQRRGLLLGTMVRVVTGHMNAFP